MKKIGAFLLTFALLAVTMIPSSLAAANNWQDTETVYSELGDVEIIPLSIMLYPEVVAVQIKLPQ